MIIRKQEKKRAQLVLKSAVNSSMMSFLYLLYKICRNSILIQENSSCMSVKLRKRNLCRRAYLTHIQTNCFMQCDVIYFLLYKSVFYTLLKMYTQISWLYESMTLSQALVRLWYYCRKISNRAWELTELLKHSHSQLSSFLTK